MGCHTSVQAAPPGQEDFHKKYTLSATIGEGTFGRVHLAWVMKTRKSVAVKVLDLRGDGSVPPEKLAKAARHEEKIWRSVRRHEHCLELMDSFVSETACFMVMEKCEASLMDKLGDVVRFRDVELSRLFREMLLGVAHVHGLRIAHRDLKPNNFLLAGEAGRTVKLCDFGLAATLPRQGGLLKGCYGTAPYMSPEMVGEWGHSLSTDIWSYGVTIYVMLYREFPYMPKENTSKAMKAAVLYGTPEPKFTSTVVQRCRLASEEAEAFARSVLKRAPSQRVTAQEALQLPFVQQQHSSDVVGGLSVQRKSSKTSSAGASLASDESTQSGGLCRRTTSASSESGASGRM